MAVQLTNVFKFSLYNQFDYLEMFKPVDTVETVLRSNSQALKVFKRYNINPFSSPITTLSDASEEVGADVEMLLQELNSLSNPSKS